MYIGIYVGEAGREAFRPTGNRVIKNTSLSLKESNHMHRRTDRPMRIWTKSLYTLLHAYILELMASPSVIKRDRQSE